MWLCIRQCHDLIFKTRADDGNERTSAIAAVERAHARIAETANQARFSLAAMMCNDVRTALNPALGLATILIIQHDAQPRTLVAATPEAGDSLAYLSGDTLDFSGLVSGPLDLGHLDLGQPAFQTEILFDQTVEFAGVWAEQQPIALWMNEFTSDGRIDALWQDIGSMPAIWSADGFHVQSADDAWTDVVPTWAAYGADDVNGDDMPAAWPTDGFSLASGNDAGFSAGWQDFPQYFDLV